MRIVSQILAGLYDAAWHAGLLQPIHDFKSVFVPGPALDGDVELGAMPEPVADGLKTSILIAPATDNIRQCGPLVFGVGRDHAPAVFAFTGVAIMGRGSWRRIADGLRIFSARCRFHEVRADHECRRFRLR